MKHPIRLLAATIGIAAAAAMSTATASASPETDYLAGLNAIGMTVYDTRAALATGYAICDALNYTTGDVVASRLFYNTSYADVPDMETAAGWVVVAGMALCPWQYHPERVPGIAT